MEYTSQHPVGSEVRGTVAAVGRPGQNFCREVYALVDVPGLKCAGSLPVSEISTDLEVGQEIEVLVLNHEDDEGLALVSREQLLIERGWSRVDDDIQARSPVSFTPEKLMKGGVIGTAKIGDSGRLEAFLPASKADVRKLHQLPRLIGQEIEVLVLEAERERGNILVSQLEALQERQQQIVNDLKEGEIYELEVSGLAAFGAFLDLGHGVSGLLHASELSWKAGKHDPRQFLSVGDKVEVVLTGIRESNEGPRIAFSKRRLTDPWHECDFKQGDLVSGRVANVKEGLGSFVSLGQYPRVVGLLRDTTFKKGDRIQVKLATFDADKQRARLELIE